MIKPKIKIPNSFNINEEDPEFDHLVYKVRKILDEYGLSTDNDCDCAFKICSKVLMDYMRRPHK